MRKRFVKVCPRVSANRFALIDEALMRRGCEKTMQCDERSRCLFPLICLRSRRAPTSMANCIMLAPRAEEGGY